MRSITVSLFCACVALSAAQGAAKSQPEGVAASVTVPITLDHNRAMIDVWLPLRDGSTKQVKAVIDNANPDLWISRRVATLLDLAIACGDQICTAKPPKSIAIRGLTLSLDNVTEVKVPLRPVTASSVLIPGMNAEINIPSTVLRNYDVLIDYPGREFTLASPGAIHFRGASNKIHLNENAVILVPAQLENKKYSLSLDLGSSISFLTEDLFEKLAWAHPHWPHMTGAIGPANIAGSDDEPNWKLMRLDRLQFSSLYLIDVPVAELPADKLAVYKQQAGPVAVGLLGADVLQNYRVGIDYAHSLVYFDIGRMSQFPEFDVVGLTLRPEDEGRFTVTGISNFEGAPAVANVQVGDQLVAVDGIPVVHSTLGQVWSMLGGSPGQERKLTIERGGKEIDVVANVRHFLATAPDRTERKQYPER